jgi:hypothetical protein
VRDVGVPSAVAMADRERRTGHGAVHAQHTAGTANERRLPGTELAGDRDDVAGSQASSQLRCDPLGLGG